MGGFSVRLEGGNKYKAVLDKIIAYHKGVRAGVPSGATNATTGASIAMYGIYNELGTKYIPPRPFMRRTQSENQDKWLHIIAGHLKYQEIEANSDKALGLAGESMKADIKQSIQHGSWAPDAPATVAAKARKGKSEPDHPLVDTGDLLKSIISEVYTE